MILFLAQILFLMAIIDMPVKGDCAHSISIKDFKEVDTITCDDDLIAVTKYGYKFTDIQCKFPFNMKKLHQLREIDAYSTEKLSFTNCVYDKLQSAARLFLQTVKINSSEVFLIHLNYVDCRFESTIEMNENLLKTFENSLRILKIFSRDDCKAKLNFSQTTFSEFGVFEEITLMQVELSGMNKFIAPPKLKNIFLEGVNLVDEDYIIINCSKSVKKLEIINCTIRNFGRNFFKNIPEIDELKIENVVGGKLIAADTFRDLRELRELVLIENEIVELQDTLFDTNLVMTSFNVSSESLSRMSENLFKNLAFLRKLTILNTKMEVMPEGLLQNSTKITDFTLSFNAVKVIPANFFSGQQSMVHLVMNDNKIEEIFEGTFANLKFCKTLNLSGNLIKSIENKIFDGMSALNAIYLNNNQIMSLGSSTFLYCRSSVQNLITLADNPLGLNEDSELIMNQFRSLPGLRHLDLRNTSLSTVSATNFLEIASVDLSYNKIDVVKFYDVLQHNNLYLWLEKARAQNTINLAGNFLNCDCKALPFLRYVQSSSNHFIRIGSSNCSSPEKKAGKSFININPLKLTCATKNCPDKCSCYERPADFTLIANCSNQNFINVPKMPELNGDLKYIELHIENNRIEEFPANDLFYYHVKQIFGRNNSLRSLHNLPLHFTLLDVRENLLTQVELKTLSILNKANASLYLSGNPWSCDCGTLNFLSFTKSNYDSVKDFELIRCDRNGKKFTEIETFDICFSFYVLIITLVSIFIGIIGLMIGLYYKYQKMIKIFLYSHGFWFVTEDDIDEDKTYDAFIVFTEQDLHDVETIVTELESGPKPFKCCVHFRDFRAGEFITEQIHNSIFESRRIIVFVSEHFKNSNWAQYEFRFAQTKAIDEKQNRNRIIVIVKGELSEVMTESLDEDLKEFLKQVTFIKFDDKWFWEKLMYSMPHRGGLSRLGYELSTQSTAI